MKKTLLHKKALRGNGRFVLQHKYQSTWLAEEPFNVPYYKYIRKVDVFQSRNMQINLMIKETWFKLL